MRKVIEGLKEQGITAFGATGYCYGGTALALTPTGVVAETYPHSVAHLIFDLAFDNIIQAAVVAHLTFSTQSKDLDVRHWSTPVDPESPLNQRMTDLHREEQGPSPHQ